VVEIVTSRASLANEFEAWYRSDPGLIIERQEFNLRGVYELPLTLDAHAGTTASKRR
jgi:hypothetical protein